MKNARQGKNRFVKHMNKRIQRIRWKLAVKITVGMLVCTVIPLTVLSAILQYNTKQFYDRNMEDLYQKIAQQYTENLRYKYNNYSNMANSVITIGSVRGLLNSDAHDFSEVRQEAMDLSTALSKMSSYYDNNNELYNLMIYSLKDTPPIYTTKIVTYKDSPNSAGITQEDIKTGYRMRSSLTGKKLLTLFFPLSSSDYAPTDVIAYIVLDIDADKFFAVPRSSYSPDDTPVAITVYDGTQPLWFSADEGIAPDKQNRYEWVEEEWMERLGWALHMEFYFAGDLIYDHYQFTIFATTGILLLLAALFAVLFSRRLSARVRALTRKMKCVQEGDMTPSPPIGGTDEMAEIDGYFNEMVRKLNVYISENYLQKIAYKEAQFNILQNQINPHFLYNTLEIIDSMASTRGCFEIGDICQRLGQLFRYSVSRSSREYVRLGDELQHVRDYTVIQKLRFSNRFQIAYEIDPGCTEWRMLKFILQPLVENAVVHALESKEKGGLLRLSARLEDDTLELEVYDNGAGFDAQKLQEYQDLIEAPGDTGGMDFSGGIGLKNVITRIKLVYGGQATVRICSGVLEGTTIFLSLPSIPGGEKERIGQDV